jgi:DNA topoisomerase III
MKVLLAEKPSVARDIARVLGANQSKNGYIEGNGYKVTWAIGHLAGLAPFDEYDAKFKRWSLDNLPFIPEKFKLTLTGDSGTKKQFNVIKSLLCDTTTREIVNCCDGAREGNLIFDYCYELSGASEKNKFAKLSRLWISSMTDEAISKGFQNLKPLSDYQALSDAARSRSEADWLVGLNVTQAITKKYSGDTGVLSVGRVQTPVLAMIVNRDLEIKDFKSEAYWELTSTYKDTLFKCERGRLLSVNEANELRNSLVDQPMKIVDISRTDKEEIPPQLYDLTTLQRSMNSTAGFSAQKTLTVLQSLYEKHKVVSYPRTDSRYLTDDIYATCPPIFTKLTSLHTGIAKLNLSSLRKDKKVFDDSKVSDHHAVIPTGKIPSGLSSDEDVVYKAVLKRFISIFYPNCKKGMTTITGNIAQELFTTKGVSISQKGWREIEAPGKEVNLPIFEKYESGPQIPKVIEGKTQAPKNYNEASLLGSMETAGKNIEDKELREAMKEGGLGTPATRAGIIETLIRRKYISRSEKKILSTEKGRVLIGLIKLDDLKSPELTGSWEAKLSKIAKNELCSKEFMREVKAYTASIIEDIKQSGSDDSISKLSDLDEPLGKCPTCGADVKFTGKAYNCSSDDCEFYIWGEFGKKKLKPTHIRQMLIQGKSEVLKGLKGKEGKAYDAALTIKEGKVEFYNETKSLGSCPDCKEGEVELNHKTAKCSGCSFTIWRNICEYTLNEKELSDILSTGKSKVLKGLKSKAGKTFDAALKLTAGGKFEMEFAAKKTATKSSGPSRRRSPKKR